MCERGGWVASFRAQCRLRRGKGRAAWLGAGGGGWVEEQFSSVVAVVPFIALAVWERPFPPNSVAPSRRVQGFGGAGLCSPFLPALLKAPRPHVPAISWPSFLQIPPSLSLVWPPRRTRLSSGKALPSVLRCCLLASCWKSFVL